MPPTGSSAGFKIGLIVVVVLFVVLVWLAVKHNNAADQENAMSTSTPAGPTSTTTAIGSPDLSQYPAGSVIIPGTNTVIVPPQPHQTSLPEPSLTLSTGDTSGMDPVFITSVEAQMKVTTGNLVKKNTSFNDWIALGLERKLLNDYINAAVDWEYASALYPQNTVSFGNLGDLYFNFIKDNAKAETNYVTAIKNNPADTQYYTDLQAVYFAQGNTSQGIDIVKQGVAKNPEAVDLYINLARYYAAQHATALAKTYYDQAIEAASKAGEGSIAASLQSEESAMK
jgi:hypothetical protein